MSLFSAQPGCAGPRFGRSLALAKCLLSGLIFASAWLLVPTQNGLILSDEAQAQALSGDRDEVEKLVTLRILGSLDRAPNKAQGAKKQAAQKSATHTEPDNTESGSGTFEREKSLELTQLVARSVRKRLKAAGIKDFSVKSSKSFIIQVRVRGSMTRSLIAGIVVPRGRFELRPVEPSGSRWVRALAHLPPGVELRQKEGSIDASEAYLWSANANTLRTAIHFLQTNPLKGIRPAQGALKFAVYPDDRGGWRTLTLSEPIATHKDIASAAIDQGHSGESYVRLLFHNQLSDALDANGALSGDANLWAVLLDGEVVSVLSGRAHNLGNSLSIMAPDQLRTPQARQSWARQVAGRLAAYIPVPVIEDDLAAPVK